MLVRVEDAVQILARSAATTSPRRQEEPCIAGAKCDRQLQWPQVGFEDLKLESKLPNPKIVWILRSPRLLQHDCEHPTAVAIRPLTEGVCSEVWVLSHGDNGSI